MSALFWVQWLAGTLAPLAALWLLFQLALRGERCFGYNRGLLLLAPLLAATWPLLPHPALAPAWWRPVAEGAGGAAVLLPALHVGPAAAAAAAPASWPCWLLALYATEVGVGLARLAHRYGQLRRATRHLPRTRQAGYVLAYTGGRLPTSSFGRTVFWNEQAGLTPAEAASVLRHELAHVRQGHSHDVLWLELWRVLLWPNPFAHLLLPTLRLTHELLADRAALAAPAGAVAPAAYPALLARQAARQALGARCSSLLQPFTFSFTLTRIAMLQSKNPVRRWKQWLVLPVLGGLFLAACQATPEPALVPPPPPPVPTAAQQAVLDAAAKGQVYTYVEQMPQLPGNPGNEAIVKAIVANLRYPELKGSAAQEGSVFAQFIVGADGKVRDAKIMKGLAPAYDEAVLSAVRRLPAFEVGRQAGIPVSVSFTVPILFRQEK